MERNPRVIVGVAAAVVAVWLVGAAITKFDIVQMAFLAPVAVLVVGLTIGVVLVWVKIVAQAIRDRRSS
ncbi:MAG: hypothetical protein U0R50_11830 [Gaiellales bacterium]